MLGSARLWLRSALPADPGSGESGTNPPPSPIIRSIQGWVPVSIPDSPRSMALRTLPPLIYGEGTGFFNRRSIQINTIMRAALRDGYASRIATGEHEWDHVHVLDLAQFYELMIVRILEGCNKLDVHSKGIYFCQSGHQTWREVSDRVARVGYALGFLKSYTVRQVTLQDAAERFWRASSMTPFSS